MLDFGPGCLRTHRPRPESEPGPALSQVLCAVGPSTAGRMLGDHRIVSIDIGVLWIPPICGKMAEIRVGVPLRSPPTARFASYRFGRQCGVDAGRFSHLEFDPRAGKRARCRRSISVELPLKTDFVAINLANQSGDAGCGSLVFAPDSD